MSAPERIWATGNGETGSWNAVEGRMKAHMPDDWQVEYVRADLCAERVQALEAENARLRGLLRAALTGRVENDLEWQIDARAALQEKEKPHD
jgi:hypothetical protein